jgi:uncharacterized protein (DUF2141 family)
VIRIVFNEYLSEPSFQQAFSITPEPRTRPEIRWKKRTVEIRMQDDLETNTTYILTIDTKLRDNHGVSLTAPITQAFSTGPEINRGAIRGRVVDPVRGAGLPGMQIFAYPLSEAGRLDSLPQRPLYRTETDGGGDFHLEYLSSQPYFILAVQDRNGNRRPDNQEVIALPPVLTIVADSAGQKTEYPWVATRLDTVAPEIRRVEALDAQTVSIRFSEDVRLPDDTEALAWVITDSLRDRRITTQYVYQLPEDTRQILVQTARLSPGAYTLKPGIVRDSTGNWASRAVKTFRLASVAEPDAAEFRSFIPPVDEPAPRVHPSLGAGVLFSRPVSEEDARDRIQVLDTAGVALEYSVQSPDGVRQMLTVPAAADGRPFRVMVVRDTEVEADSSVVREFSFLAPRDLGAIVGVVEGVTTDSTVFVDAVTAPSGPIVSSSAVTTSGAFAIDSLRVGSYTLRVRRDDNRNGKWDGGKLIPFEIAEPLFWRADSIRVRARWDTDIDTLRTSIIDR